jgi:outer membrane protein assembly factor BamB
MKMRSDARLTGIMTVLTFSLTLSVFADEIKHKFVATDESGKQLIYVDEANPANDWTVPLPGNRDIQLSKDGTVLVSVPSGYREYSLKDGKMIKEVQTEIKVTSLVRLSNGHTLLAGSAGVVELDKDDKKVAFHEKALGPFFRLLRVAGNGNFLYTSGQTTITEMTPEGKDIRALDLSTLTPESKKPYFAEELADGRFLIATGYGATVLIVDKDWKLISSYGGKSGTGSITPNFFADAQQLTNGNVVVAHWSGHARKDSEKAPQAIEFDKSGKIVWSWHDAKRAGSLHGIEIIE